MTEEESATQHVSSNSQQVEVPPLPIRVLQSNPITQNRGDPEVAKTAFERSATISGPFSTIKHPFESCKKHRSNDIIRIL